MVLLGILIGCATTAAVDTSGPAHAEPRTQTWEHMCLGPSMSLDGVNDDVRKGGAEGWELVTMFGGIVCFKRPAKST